MIVAISHATGIKLAEVGFLLILIAGVWLVASEIAALGAVKWHKFRIFSQEAVSPQPESCSLSRPIGAVLDSQASGAPT